MDVFNYGQQLFVAKLQPLAELLWLVKSWCIFKVHNYKFSQVCMLGLWRLSLVKVYSVTHSLLDYRDPHSIILTMHDSSFHNINFRKIGLSKI